MTKTKMLRGVLKLPGEEPRVHEIEAAGIEPLQALVGGYFDCVSPRSGPPAVRRLSMWINDEGKAMGLPPNIYHGEDDFIAGPIFVTDIDKEGESKSLSKAQEKAVIAFFQVQSALAMFVAPK